MKVTLGIIGLITVMLLSITANSQAGTKPDGILNKGIRTGTITDIQTKNNNRSQNFLKSGLNEDPDDVTGPEIIYNILPPSVNTSGLSVTATITDDSGIMGARLYYRKLSDENIYNDNTPETPGWKYSDGKVNKDEYLFYIDYNLINGGVKTGDEIEYFYIAQDGSVNQNISVSTGVFNQEPKSIELISENFPVIKSDLYRLAESIEGTYYVGDGQAYESLTGENGFFEYLMENIITGDVYINITSDINESGMYALNSLIYEGGMYNIIISTDAPKERTLYGTTDNAALISLIGVSNVTIDGSYYGEGRYLNFTNESTASNRAVIMIGSNNGEGGNNITIQNCNIFNINHYNTSLGIIVSDNVISTTAFSPNLSNLTIRNNHIYRSQMGILARGASYPGGFLNNLIIEDNLIGHENEDDQIYMYGMDVMNAPSARIKNNTIFNIANDSYYKFGIQIGNQENVEGMVLENNKIYKLRYIGVGGWGAFGINVVSGRGHVIMNNMISDIKSDRYSPSSDVYNPFGIRIQGGSEHKIWHNSISMTGYQEGWNSNPSLTANILIMDGCFGMDIRGNIMHNSLEGISGTRSFDILVKSSSVGSAFAVLDNNIYSAGGEAGVIAGYGVNPPYTEFNNMDDWKSQTGMDNNSKNYYTEFLNADENMHLNGHSVGNSELMYEGMPEIQNDADGETRNSPTYYGADELNYHVEFSQNTIVYPEQEVQCVDHNAIVVVYPDVTEFKDGIERNNFDAFDYQWYKNGTLLEGATGQFINYLNVQMSDSARYYAICSFKGETLISQEVLLKVETPLSFTQQPSDKDVCIENPVLNLYSAGAGTLFGYQWEFKKEGSSDWEEIDKQTSQNLNLSMNYDRVGEYRLKLMGPGNCGASSIYTNAVKVIFSVPLTNVSIIQNAQSANKDLGHVCNGESISLKALHEGTVFGYRWQRDNGSGFTDVPVFRYPTANSQILQIENGNIADNGIYRCLVIGSASCGTASIASQPITVKVWENFSVDEQPQSTTLCENGNASIRVIVSGWAKSYNWYKNGELMTAKENESFDKPVLYFNNVEFDNSGIYRCRIIAEDCSGPYDLMSDEAAVYVITGTEIIVPPVTQSVMLGGSVNFVVRAHVNGAPKNYKPEVQWYRGNLPLIEGGRFIGTKSDHLVISNLQDSDFGEDYRVVVTGSCGWDEASLFGILKGMITISQQPVGKDLCEDQEVVLEVKANSSKPNDELTYQWYKDGVLLTDGNGITGAKSEKLTISPAKSENTGLYHALIKEKNAVAGLMTVDAPVNVFAKPVITVQPVSSLNVVPGKEIKLSVTAIGDDLEYQWYFEGSPITMQTANILIISNAVEGNSGKYTVDVINSCGSVMSLISNVTVTTNTSDVTDSYIHGFKLDMASPNPVQSVTELPYLLPQDGKIVISLINELGAEIAVLENGFAQAGSHKLTIDTERLNLSSGIYNVILKSSGIMISQRIVVIK